MAGLPSPSTSRSLGRAIRSILVAVAGCAILIAGTMMFSADPSDSELHRLTHTVTSASLTVSILEQGTIESSGNTEIKCGVRGDNIVIEVVESGTWVEPGDVLVRLDTLFIDEQIAERTKYALWTESGRAATLAHYERSKLAVEEYRQGRYQAELKTLQKDLAIAEANLVTAESMLAHAKKMRENDYVSNLDVEERQFAVKQANLAAKLRQTQIDVLKNFTRHETLATLVGNMKAAEARFKAEDERLYADRHRLQRALDEKELCIVRAETAGMVIHPSAARWKNAPEIEEGATVHKDQILLLMPDLSKMQVKVGVHESIVDRVKTGLRARVAIPERALKGEVSAVASVTSPAGWWTGNRVNYETIIELPAVEGLRPGMSSEVEIILAEYDDVLTVPVAAILETTDRALCWVRTATGTEMRGLELGDSNDISIIVKSGLSEGEEVILNPLMSVQEAKDEAARTLAETTVAPAEQIATEAPGSRKSKVE